MKRILSILFCLCFLTGCGLFYPPRHEVLITQQSYQAYQENQTGQTGQGSAEEIPLLSTPPVNSGSNSIIVKETRTCYTPSTQVVFGFYPGFYTGFYPRWGYYPYRRYHYWGGYPYRRHHFHRPPPPPYSGGHRPPPPHGGHRPPPR